MTHESLQRHTRLHGLLEVSRLVRSGGDLTTLLEAIARIVSESLGVGTVVISLHRPAWDDFHVAAVHGSREARTALLGQALDHAYWEPLLDPRFEHRGVHVVPREERDWDADGGRWFVPAAPPPDGPDSWDPADALLAPMRHSDGSLLGIISVNDPASGRRPADEELDVLAALAAAAAQAIESAQDAEASRRHSASLEHLLRVSTELPRSPTPEAILQLVCEGIRDALGFRLVVVELADREADRYRPTASVGTDLARDDVQLTCTISELDSIFDPALEIEGCYLCSREQALERVAAEPTDFSSTLNGRGPRGWNRHWLLVPLEDRSGRRIGFIWADDPEDRLVPSQERLQALRMFANTAAQALDSAARLEALREAEEMERAIIEATPLALVALDRDGVVRSWNPAAERMLGWPAEEAIGGLPPQLPSGEIGDFRALLARVLGGEMVPSFEVDRRRRDGSTITTSLSTAPIRDAEGRVVGVMTALEDVTERRRDQADLARRNAELEALHETTLRLLDGLDPESVLHAIVGRAGELVGTPHGYVYVVDEEADDLVMAVTGGGFAQYRGLRLARGEGLSGRVWEEARPSSIDDYASWDGRANAFEAPPFRANAAVPLTSGARIVGVLGLAFAETGRTFGDAELALLERFGRLASLALENARLYDELSKSRELYRSVIENATDLIALMTPDGRILYASPSHRDVLGYEPEDFEGQDVRIRVHPEDEQLSATAMAETLEHGESTYTLRLQHRDGRWITVEGTTKLLRDPGGHPRMVHSTARDVTERRVLEEQLRQSQKMEAIGRLAGGIAHDFNNLLTAIGGYGDFALAGLPRDSIVRGHVEEMKRAGERAAALTRQLLAFSRRQVLQPVVLDLNDVVAGMEGMLARLLGEDVQPVVSLAHDLGRTRADRGQVEQVLMNLAVNARDAMPRGGRLTIATANVDLDERFAREHVGGRSGSYVMLSVADTGEGMDRETLERVFEPFFTTKPAGQGTGLGLATAYGIVKQSDGQIWAHSEPGHGTTFKVYLPRVCDRVEAALGEPRGTAPQATGSETILLVEDEDVVREIVVEMLEACGFRVLAAASGDEALEAAAAHEGPIDALVTDVVMPGLSGQEVAARLARGRPGIRVVFTSGYTEDAIANHGVLSPGTAFLEKPFTAAQLAGTLRHVLDARAAA